MGVFVMIPFRPEFDRTYEVIRNAIEEHRLKSIIEKDQWHPGPIDQKIREHIAQSRLCVADLTGLNANVMYEVGIAHELEKPVILITQDSMDRLPFDIRQHRTIRYAPTPEGYRALKKSLLSSLSLEESPTNLLRQILMPESIDDRKPYVVAACPLSYRFAFWSRGGWPGPPKTFSDYVGIRGLMQSFGMIFGLNQLPELLNPDDYKDDVIDQPMHLYTVASPKANRWTGLMMEKFFEKRNPQWEFKPDPESASLRNPRVLIRLAKKTYQPPYQPPSITGRLKWDYGLVIRGPKPSDSSCLFMALAGRSSLGTEAACLAVTDLDCLSVLIKRLRGEKINLRDHTQAFCAVVCIESKGNTPCDGVDKDTFRVLTVSLY